MFFSHNSLKKLELQATAVIPDQDSNSSYLGDGIAGAHSQVLIAPFSKAARLDRLTMKILDRLAKKKCFSCMFYNNDEKQTTNLDKKILLLQNYPVHGEVFLAPAIEDKTTF